MYSAADGIILNFRVAYECSIRYGFTLCDICYLLFIPSTRVHTPSTNISLKYFCFIVVVVSV